MSLRCHCGTVLVLSFAHMYTAHDAHGDHASMHLDLTYQALSIRSFTSFTMQLEGVLILSVQNLVLLFTSLQHAHQHNEWMQQTLYTRKSRHQVGSTSTQLLDCWPP